VGQKLSNPKTFFEPEGGFKCALIDKSGRVKGSGNWLKEAELQGFMREKRPGGN
jgi:hypothetical protein